MNRASYNRIAAQWDLARTCFYGREEQYLEMLLAELQAGACVLDLGCGSGRPMAEWLLSRGYQVTGVDQSEALLELARTRFPEAEWIHCPLEELALDRRFDAAILWDSLFHIERHHHGRVLASLYQCLRPGGRLMLTVGGSAHPAFTDTMFGETFFYDSHPPEEVRTILTGIGFEVLLGEL